MKMPIPTRARPEPQAGTETNSKIPSAKLHHRTTSTAVPDAAKIVSRTHQRATSLIPGQAKVGLNEPYSSSLLRKPSVRTNVTSNLRQSTTAARQAPKPDAATPVSFSSAPSNTDAGLKQPTFKPQFTAYQQHFSPKKPPRPASIAIDTPSSNEGAITTHHAQEVARLRDELLQLRLLHSGSKQSLQRFESDAKMKLKSKFDALIEQKESILALEQRRNCCISHIGLQNWLRQGDEVSGNKLQQLASCLRDLDGHLARGGRHSSLMREFQAWFEHMILALDGRKQSIETTSQTLLFVEPIDPLWSQEVAIIQRKLRSLKQTLHDLGDSDAGGIQSVLNGYRNLANNLHEELDTCISIHKIALEQEDAWVGGSLQRLLERAIPAPKESEPICRKGVWEDRAADLR